MNNQQEIDLFVILINNAIYNGSLLQAETGEVNWKHIYQLAGKNKLAPLLYNEVLKLSEHDIVPQEILEDWKAVTLQGMIYESQKYAMLLKILNLAKERKIQLILFKGCILSNLYPNYLSRVSSDTDIFVYPQEKENVVRLFEDMGFRKSSISSKDSVYNYILDSLHYKVEVHFSLWEDFKSTKIDLLDQMQLTKEETLIRFNACGIEVTTLGYEEHLIYQVFHMIKHFALQGINIRYLVDITLYINRYGEHIDFGSFWNRMELLKYDKFCENFFYLCIQYFGMASEILEDRKIKLIRNMDEFFSDLMNVGPGYEKRTAAWHLVGIMEPYFLGDQAIPRSKFRRRLKMLFPPRETFPIEYARKHPVLLPVAWMHRCISLTVKLVKKRENDINEKMFLSEIRLSLMKNLGLTNGGKKL